MGAPFRVLVADDLAARGLEILAASQKIQVEVRTGLTPAELAQAIRGYHGLVVRSATKVTAAILESADALRIIGRAGIGTDNIDVAAASRRGIIVENTPGGNATTAAEHALCLLLAMVRFVPQATASIKAGRWEKKRFRGVELTGKTLGVVGLGNIGRIVCERARGLKMEVLVYDPFVGAEAAERLGAELVGLDELCTRSDFITLHTPLTPETRGIIGAAALGRMKRGVYLVNAARGGLVDEDALLAALDSGQVAGAALDVFVNEPPDPGSRLVQHERVICTPHLGASTGEAQEKVGVEVAEQLVAFAERGEVRNAVNAHAVRAELLPRVGPWLDLAQRLGRLLAQLLPRGEGIGEVEIETSGEVTELAGETVGDAALAGLLASSCDGMVNDVNARLLAEERHLPVTEVRRPRGPNFDAVVTVRSRGGGAGVRAVTGTVFQVGETPSPRLVQVDDTVVDAALEGHLLVVHNVDRPGVIGAVGTLLGQRGINVSHLHVGRGSGALMVWQIDGELDAAGLAAVRGLAHIRSADQVIL
jgi:D-3-phosphoglycerate dehydrogenase